MKLPIAQIDAFASRPFEGNPAAVMPLDAWLDDATLQAIAAENNLSETAFIVASHDDGVDFDLRWFTPADEVRLCGHATLASGHFVLSSHPHLDSVCFRTRRAGALTVTRVDGGYELALPAWPPHPAPLPDVVAALGVDAVETLWRDGGYRVIVVADEATVLGLTPDLRKLAEGGDRQTIVTAPGDATDVVTRMFAPGAGIDEDPVTGSAHAVIVPYWAERLGRTEFTAYQASKRGGHLACRLEGDRVILGGQCVTVMEGTFLL